MKTIVLFYLIAGMSCSSCKKEGQLKLSAADTAITILSPNGGETYYAGNYITIKWKGSNLPTGTVITAGLQNINGTGVVEYGLKPQHPAKSDVTGSTDNTGEEIFQLPVDTVSIYHEKMWGMMYTYGKSFKVSLTAVFPHAGKSILLNNLFRASHSEDFFTVIAPVYPAGCISSIGYSTTTGQPCNVPH
jgi:hypothetical protein